MKVGYIQTSPIYGEKQANFDQAEELLGKETADLIVVPELFATGYTFTSKNEALELAEETNGETADFLMHLAKKSQAIVIGGYAEKTSDGIFNSAMVVSEEGVIGNYRKIHLYFKEKLWFNPGNEPPKVFECKDFKLGVMICFDWIFPETTRTLALNGADIIAHPANLVLPYCQKAMVTRCLENRVYAVTANRIGNETRGNDSFQFTGGSQITSYDGTILSSAPNDRPTVGFAEIDISKARNKTLNEYNNLFNDRRTELYDVSG